MQDEIQQSEELQGFPEDSWSGSVDQRQEAWNLRFIETCRSELNTPFKIQGRASKHGLDCAGLIVVSARKMGIPASDKKDYSYRVDPILIVQALEESGCYQIPLKQANAGDILVMTFERNPRHLAVVTERRRNGSMRIIHASLKDRKVVEYELTEDLKRKIIAVYRFNLDFQPLLG